MLSRLPFEEGECIEQKWDFDGTCTKNTIPNSLLFMEIDVGKNGY